MSVFIVLQMYADLNKLKNSWFPAEKHHVFVSYFWPRLHAARHHLLPSLKLQFGQKHELVTINTSTHERDIIEIDAQDSQSESQSNLLLAF